MPDTHPTASPVGAPPKPKPGPKPGSVPTSYRKKPAPGACGCKCAGGYPCASTQRLHVLHLCKHPDCECRDRLREAGTGVSK